MAVNRVPLLTKTHNENPVVDKSEIKYETELTMRRTTTIPCSFKNMINICSYGKETGRKMDLQLSFVNPHSAAQCTKETY